MSGWEGYLVPSVAECAVISAQGAICAKSAAFKASQAEISQWVERFSNVKAFQGSSIQYGGKKVLCLGVDDMDPEYPIVHFQSGPLAIFFLRCKSIMLVGARECGPAAGALRQEMTYMHEYCKKAQL